MNLPTFIITWSSYPTNGNRDEMTDHHESWNGTSITRVRRRMAQLKKDDNNTNVTLSVAIDQ